MKIYIWDEDVTDFIYEVSVEIDECADDPSIESWTQIVLNITTDVDEF